jgi:hypothetical protein
VIIQFQIIMNPSQIITKYQNYHKNQNYHDFCREKCNIINTKNKTLLRVRLFNYNYVHYCSYQNSYYSNYFYSYSKKMLYPLSNISYPHYKKNFID